MRSLRSLLLRSLLAVAALVVPLEAGATVRIVQGDSAALSVSGPARFERDVRSAATWLARIEALLGPSGHIEITERGMHVVHERTLADAFLESRYASYADVFRDVALAIKATAYEKRAAMAVHGRVWTIELGTVPSSRHEVAEDLAHRLAGAVPAECVDRELYQASDGEGARRVHVIGGRSPTGKHVLRVVAGTWLDQKTAEARASCLSDHGIKGGRVVRF